MPRTFSSARKQKRILVISEFGRAADNSTGHLISGMPDLLHPVHTTIVDKTNMPRGFRILYNGLSKIKGLGPVRKAITAFGLAASAWMKKNDYDVVIVVSNPFISLILPAWIWRGRKTKLAYLTLDLFPENLAATGLSVPAWLTGLFKRQRDKNLRKADTVISIGVDMKKHLKDILGTSEKLIYAPMWIDDSDQAECPPADVPQPTGAPINLHFFGNIGMVQDFSKLFDILQMHQNLRLDVYGSGAKVSSFQEHAGERAVFHGPVAFTKRSTVFRPGIIGVVPQPLTLKGLAVPSKALYYWSRGYPVLFLGSAESELGQLITKSPWLGLVIEPDQNPKSLEQDLRKMCTSPDKEKIVLQCPELRATAKAALQKLL